MNYFKDKRREKQFHRCGELGRAWPQLQQWYSTSLGQRLAEQEAALLSEALTNLFGFHLLQLGQLGNRDWLNNSRISHCSVMDFMPVPRDEAISGFHGLPDALPIQADSIDVMVLPHTLEFSLTPHTILREVDRVLVPEGHLVMLVFNPISLWSFWRWMFGWRKRVPWCGRFLSTGRIRDWMALLGFDVKRIHGYFYQLPVQNKRVAERMGFCEGLGRRCWPFLGAANMIVATKRVTTLTPVRPRWRAKAKPVVTPGLIEPFQNKDKHVE